MLFRSNAEAWGVSCTFRKLSITIFTTRTSFRNLCHFFNQPIKHGLARLASRKFLIRIISNNAYQMAAECCDKVMAMGYILEPDFKANFSLTNESSREAILAAPFSETDTDKDNRWQLMNRTLHYKDQLALSNGVSAWNGVCAQPEYVKLFSDDDPRKEATFLIGRCIMPRPVSLLRQTMVSC